MLEAREILGRAIAQETQETQETHAGLHVALLRVDLDDGQSVRFEAYPSLLGTVVEAFAYFGASNDG